MNESRTSTEVRHPETSKHWYQEKSREQREAAHVEGLEIRTAFYSSVTTLEARNQCGKYVKILKEKYFPTACSLLSVKYHEAVFRNAGSPQFASRAPSPEATRGYAGPCLWINQEKLPRDSAFSAFHAGQKLALCPGRICAPFTLSLPYP